MEEDAETVAQRAAWQAELDRLRAKAEANRAELETMARKCKRLALGTDPMPTTVAGRDTLLKQVCEMLGRLYFNEKFGDPE